VFLGGELLEFGRCDTHVGELFVLVGRNLVDQRHQFRDRVVEQLRVDLFLGDEAFQLCHPETDVPALVLSNLREPLRESWQVWQFRVRVGGEGLLEAVVARLCQDALDDEMVV
jgi:hypothetical protein